MTLMLSNNSATKWTIFLHLRELVFAFIKENMLTYSLLYVFL